MKSTDAGILTICLKEKFDTGIRAVEIQVVEHGAIIKIPLQVPIPGNDIEVLELVPEACRCLPGHLRTTGADVQVIGQV